MLGSIAKLGAKDVKTLRQRKKLPDEFMELRLAPRMFDALILNLRTHVSEVRQLEKEIMVIAVRDAGMPRKDFIASFPKNETNPRWLSKHVKGGKKYSAPLAKFKDEIERRQKKLEIARGRSTTSRSTTSRTSTARSRSARPRRAAPRRRWSRRTCAW